MSLSRFASFLAALLLATTASAASYIVPTDAELIASADAIAVLSIESSHSYFDGRGRIITEHHANVESALKAHPTLGSTVVLIQLGGVVGNIMMSVTTEPLLRPGDRALFLLEATEYGRFAIASGELGRFDFVRDTLRPGDLLVRGRGEGISGRTMSGDPHEERERDAEAFLRYIERIVTDQTAPVDYFVSGDRRVQTDAHVPGNDFMTPFAIGGTSRGARWASGGFTLASVGTQATASNLAGSINTARGAWNGDSNSSINIGYSGPSGSSGEYGKDDEKDLIFFDQPNAGPLAGSAVGQANIWATSSTNTNGGDTYFTAIDCDIVIETGLSGSTFEAVMAHEMGHCLGFRHSNAPYAGQTTQTSTALMNSSVISGGATLRDWDRDAASHVYGSGVSACTPPAITTQPVARTITAGQTANLSVAASGTAPLSYQWFVGSPGDTSNPVSGATSASATVTPATTTTYWVRVTGQCGTPAASAPVTVTVNACTPPSITNQPDSGTIIAGQTATLSVTAAGTAPLQYQWFVGAPGTTTTPVSGGTTSRITVSPNATTTYWVRVTGQCSPPVNSAAATVTVTPCSPASITAQPSSTTVTRGGSVQLRVSAAGTGPLRYQWYTGTAGNTAAPIAGATAATVTVTPATTTSYWVRVIAACGNPTNSSAATVTVTEACVVASITGQPQAVTIGAGEQATLSVIAAGSGLSYQWFRGTSGNVADPVQGATGPTLVVSPTLTTSYWVRVTATCGVPVNSAAATVTVTGPCVAPVITSITPSQTVRRNSSVQLSVAASGTTPITYQWYEGPVGDLGRPSGSTAAITVGPITAPTRYWVRLNNPCGEATSTAIPISLATPRRRAVGK